MEVSTDEKKAKSSSDDRLSNLPQDVLHYILSDFETRDVIGMSVLSKKWRFFWTSMPYLNLSDWPFHGHKAKFKDFCSSTLFLRDQTSIKRFCFKNYFASADKMYYNRLLARLNTEEIHLHGFFPLPGCLLDSKSLRVLKCTFGKILEPPKLTGVGKLTSLCLMRVEIQYSRFGPELFSNLPFLEDLKMANCEMAAVEIFEVNATKLKIMTFINAFYFASMFEGALRVVAPNLKSFYYGGPLLSDYSLENLSSLLSASVYITRISLLGLSKRCHHLHKLIQGFHDVRDLRLSSRFLEHLPTKVDIPGCFLNRLYNLKCLKISVQFCTKTHMESILCLLNHSPYLETLILDFVEIGDKTDLKLSFQEVCLIDHLKTVEISSFEGGWLGLELVKFLLCNGIILEIMAIKYKNRRKKKRSFKKVLAFPKASPHVDISFPGFGSRKIFWERDEYPHLF